MESGPAFSHTQKGEHGVGVLAVRAVTRAALGCAGVDACASAAQYKAAGRSLRVTLSLQNHEAPGTGQLAHQLPFRLAARRLHHLLPSHKHSSRYEFTFWYKIHLYSLYFYFFSVSFFCILFWKQSFFRFCTSVENFQFLILASFREGLIID